MAENYTPEQANAKQEVVLKTLRSQAGNVSKACAAANISRETYYRWLDSSDEFKQRVEEAMEELIDFAESILMTMIKNKNTAAVTFFLKTKGKHRGYGE
jgi:hypothetical protein